MSKKSPTMPKRQKIFFIVISVMAFSGILHLWSETPLDYMSTSTLLGIFSVIYVLFLGYFIYVSRKYAGWIRGVSAAMAVVCIIVAGHDLFMLSLGAMQF